LPNIFKYFTRAKAEEYRFPNALDLMDPEDSVSEESTQAESPEELPDAEPPETQTPPDVEETPVSFAQVQADAILAEARRQADDILAEARERAQEEAKQERKKAQEEGYQEGYAQGMAQAMTEAAQAREEQAQELEKKVDRFLERAGAELDRQMDESVDDLRDLAMAVAEKVVAVSLKSSGEVISRMIQTAIDKRKRREWVHIYISECDAKLLTQVPASLSASLRALSDRVRIIPMADDESGTCIIEMPDEIVDASAATQFANLRSLLMDTPSGGTGGF